jgi:hypothetical protein
MNQHATSGTSVVRAAAFATQWYGKKFSAATVKLQQ